MPVCSSCGGEMEGGFLLSGRYQQEWVKGAHERSFWTSTVLAGKELYVVETHRCLSCGLLVSFATEKSK